MNSLLKLLETTLYLAKTDRLQVQLEKLAHALTEIVLVKNVYIWLESTHDQIYELQAGHLTPFSTDRSDKLRNWAASRKASLIARDAVDFLSPTSAARFFYKVPLSVDDQAIGLIIIGMTDEISRRDKRLLSLLVRHASVYLQNALKNDEKDRHIAYVEEHDFILTGLQNRLAWKKRLDVAIQQAQQTGQHLLLIFVDTDDFKKINESFGHEVGDQYLREIARVLESFIGEQPFPALLARMGGDEFALFFEGIADINVGAGMARGLLDKFKQPLRLNAETTTVTLSAGISIYPNDGKTVDDLLRQADRAMYAAKSSGKNRCCFANADTCITD